MPGTDELFPDAERDERRHRERLGRIFREGVDRILRQRDILGSPDGKTVRIPIRAREDPVIRVVPRGGEEESERGLGQGSAKPGDVLARVPKGGSGSRAGDRGHEPDYYIEMTLEELADWVFHELRLPVIQPRSSPRALEEDVKLDARHPRGPDARLDKKKSLLDHLRREILTGDAGWHEEDLRYRVFRVTQKPTYEAAVILVRDASGSMGQAESDTVFLAAWWTVLWLRRNYQRVQLRFVLHGTEAREVEEQEFFTAMDMGGTAISSGLRLAREILEKDYPDANQYVLFFSDGEDFFGDMAALAEETRRLLQTVDLLGYGEVRLARSTHLYNGAVISILHNQFADAANLRWYTPLKPETLREFLLRLFGREGARQP